MTTTRRYVKNEKGYEKSVKADWDAVKKGLKKARAEVGEPKKVPTSVALDPRFVADLKKEAESRRIPYQTLIGSLLHRYSNGELVDKKNAADIVSLKSA